VLLWHDRYACAKCQGARGQDVFDTGEADWQAALAQLVVSSMRKQRDGSILAILSLFGCESRGRIGYTAFKAASISLTKALARVLATSGIPVNSVAPDSLLFPGRSSERKLHARSAGHRALYTQQAPSGTLRHTRGGDSGRLSRFVDGLACGGGIYPRRWRAITLQYLR